MICILSPAKAMDLSGSPECGVMSEPSLGDTAELLKVCKKLTAGDLKKLMGVSDAIAQKDLERYQQWDTTARKAACLAMDGPAYRGLDAASFSAAEKKVAQDKIRILSGLYGVLKPFDAIRPYRLEMGSKLQTARGKNLYEFWGGTIANRLGKGAKLLVNAASQEYWKAVQSEALGDTPVLTVDFPGPSVYAKKARGLICRYIVQRNCQKAEDLKAFVGETGDSYAFDASKSTKDRYVFRRVAGNIAVPKSFASPDKKGAKRPAEVTPQKAGKRSRSG